MLRKKYFKNTVFVNWGASFRGSSSQYRSMRNTDEMTIGRTYPTKNFQKFFSQSRMFLPQKLFVKMVVFLKYDVFLSKLAIFDKMNPFEIRLI